MLISNVCTYKVDYLQVYVLSWLGTDPVYKSLLSETVNIVSRILI